MARTEASQDIQRSPQDVFEYVSNPEHYPDWAGMVLESRNIRRPTFTQEGHYTSISKFLGRRMELDFRMLVTEHPLTLRLEALGGPIPHSWQYTFEPQGNGTRVTVVVDGDPGTFFALAAPLVMNVLHREMQTELLTLKSLLETVVPSAPVTA